MNRPFNKTRAILNELKQNNVSRESRKSILEFFLSEENKWATNSLLLSQNSILRSELLSILWIEWNFMHKLKDYFSTKDFNDSKVFFDDLRDFFSSEYYSLDVAVYRYNSIKNSLSFFAWRNSYETDISISDIDWDDFKNERAALKNWSFHYTLLWDETHFWARWSIKILTDCWDIYLICFFDKDDTIDVTENLVDRQICSVRNLFKISWLDIIIQKTLSWISSKYKDKLTWLYKREYIDSLNKNTKYSALFIDIDDFKSLNDTYWHQAWDEVLITFSSKLRDIIKPRDKACRVSWDEFIILMPTNNSQAINSLHQRISQLLNNLEFEFVNTKTWNLEKVKLSASIWKWISDSKKWLSEILKEADIDMYSSKTSEWKLNRLKSALNKLDTNEQASLILSSSVCSKSCWLSCWDVWAFCDLEEKVKANEPWKWTDNS